MPATENAAFDSRSSPTLLEPHSATELKVGWSTGAVFAIPYFELRFHCPCANCVDEHTGVRTLKRENVAADVRPLEVHAVGRYAIQFTWSDRHSTGMYPYDLLYALGLDKGLRLA